MITDIDDARDEVVDSVLPNDDYSGFDSKFATMYAPPLYTLRFIAETESVPFTIGDVVVESFSARGGNPKHGAKCSYDHIAEFHARTTAVTCSECGASDIELHHSKYHNISVSRAVVCRFCDAVLFEETA